MENRYSQNIILAASKSLFIFCVGLLFIAQNCNAQDPHFSQYYLNPTQLNPALVGVYSGQKRFTAQYRDQWKGFLGNAGFTTYNVSADFKFHHRRDDYWGLGISLLADRSGEGRFAQTLANVSGSYIKRMGGNDLNNTSHFLSAALKIGFGQNSLRWSSLWFGNQFDRLSEVVDFAADSGENLSGNNTKSGAYADLGLGLLWYTILGKNKSLYGGFAMDHIAEPEISLIGGFGDLPRKLTIHGGAELTINQALSLLPSFVWWKQGVFNQLMAGTNLRLYSSDKEGVALRVGTALRWNSSEIASHIDALIVSFGFEIRRLTIGMSYDVTISDLHDFNSRKGAFELSIVYLNPIRTRKFKVNCPKL